ncbi:MAG TPA: N-acetyl-gamma-glutamyl-phosphate reductase [Clostridia bacterium]|nr:N-acetyl-gamma-glutamyl-phosphate reductase [Clostridia bacterium]HPQ46721.1 N-acetyl-gamma-glutamyl-phosphate reductase [Clostridia bacterium]HRX41952.1 N-acetyl-gamma-glutamyl-phosphate reductase [Clostridia bacterium]
MVKVGILGATGYAGAEAVRILSGHPGFEVTAVASKSFEGSIFSDIYTNMKGVCDLVCESSEPLEISEKADCFICALPHAASQKAVAVLTGAGKKVVDLSADFRYSDASTYEKTYGVVHEYPELLDKAVYGLPELNRAKIKDALVTANPGCYPTCSILGLAPLVSKGMIDPATIIINAVSGVSGAGRKADLPYQYCEIDGNFAPYKVTGHRHTTEIEEQLSILSGKTIAVGFTPHLAPFKRGMVATIYASLLAKSSAGELIQLYKEYYAGEYFVRIREAGDIPSVKAVAGTNFADIAPIYDERLGRVIIVSAIDNLGKGASSQAVQNLNIMYGFDEKAGIAGAGLYI